MSVGTSGAWAGTGTCLGTPSGAHCHLPPSPKQPIPLLILGSIPRLLPSSLPVPSSIPLGTSHPPVPPSVLLAPLSASPGTFSVTLGCHQCHSLSFWFHPSSLWTHPPVHQCHPPAHRCHLSHQCHPSSPAGAVPAPPMVILLYATGAILQPPSATSHPTGPLVPPPQCPCSPPGMLLPQKATCGGRTGQGQPPAVGQVPSCALAAT